MAQARRQDQTRERRQFAIALTRVTAALVASGDLPANTFRASDRVSALVVNRELVLIRDRVTERVVPPAEPEAP